MKVAATSPFVTFAVWLGERWLRLVQLLGRRGRLGGVIVLLSSGVMAAASVWLFRSFSPWNEQPSWSPALTIISILLMPFALVGGASGLSFLISPPRVPPSLGPEEFLRQLGEHRQPFRVCLRCRIIFPLMSGAWCTRCLSDEDCVRIASPGDLAAATATATATGIAQPRGS